MNPDKLIETWFVKTRPATIAAWILLLYGITTLFALMAMHRTAAVSGDPYTYLQFAQTLADGSFRIGGVPAEVAEHFSAAQSVEAAAAARPGPIWNTNVLPDGGMVYTVAMGYPLFLAGMLKLGGYWFYTHINVFLLGLLLILLFGWVWNGLDRSLFATAVAGAACLFLVRSHPPTFLQFSHPWREPLFYCCIVGAMVCLQSFARHGRLLLVPAAGFLLGYATAIKEPNAIYAVVIGLGFLCTSAFRRSNRKFLLLFLFGAAGVAGVSPILFQNWLTSGNPLRSLQVVRATADFAGGGSGLSPSHIGETFTRYHTMYRGYGLFWWPWMLVAIVGICSLIRKPLIRLCVGLMVVHLALYLQWGNADFRHMYFGHIPYAIFLAGGSVWLCTQVARSVPALHRFANLAVLLPVLVLALWPSPWKQVREGTTRFSTADAIRVVSQLQEAAPEQPVFLSNRILRDVLGTYSAVPVIRLHDLAQFHPEERVEPIIDWLLDRGYRVLFLDNADKDPRNVGQVDWALVDREWLLDGHDLDESFSLSRGEYGLEGMIDKPELTAYEVKNWSSMRAAKDLSVPAGGAAFLYVHPRALGTNLSVSIDGVETDANPALQYYRPTYSLGLSGDVAFTASAGSSLLPALRDVRLVSWTEPMNQSCGVGTTPPDSYLFPDGALIDQSRGSYRYLEPPVRLRVPVRKRPGQFTTIGLGLNLIEGETNLNVFIETEAGLKEELKVAGGTAWFPLLAADQPATWAGEQEVTMTTDGRAVLKLTRVKSLASRSSLSFEFPPDTVGALLAGTLTPTRMGEGPHDWLVRIDGEERKRGRCFDDPRRSANQFHMSFSRSSTAIDLQFEGCGLVDARWVPVFNSVSIRPRTVEAACIRSGLHKAEGRGPDSFWWTTGETTIAVPVQTATGYELTLDVADNRPGRKRDITVQFGAQSQSISLGSERALHRLSWPGAPANESGLQNLRIVVETWVPAEESPGSRDHRQLGVQLYGVDWRPVPERGPNI